MLVRDYLRKALYDSRQGYFIQAKPINYREGRTVNFTQLQGRKEWMRVQQDMFVSPGETGGGEWLTQSELFAPYFSRTLMEFAVRSSRRKDKRLNIVEIGGGSGTNALHFLDGLKARYPELYSRSRYTLCEISSTLARTQLGRLWGRHENVCEVKNEDFLQWPQVVEEETIIIMMEVLDNLPHDKVVYKGPETKYRDFQVEKPELWDQVLVPPLGIEIREPLKDPIVRRALELFLARDIPRREREATFWKQLSRDVKKFITQISRRFAERNGKSMFIPTGSLNLLDVLKQKFPQHVLLAGDFSFLPFGDVAKNMKHIRTPGSLFGCKNAPIVSGMDRSTGTRKDFPSYILPTSQPCDVFFQTDFNALASVYETQVGGRSEVRTSPQFMSDYSQVDDRKATTTMSGYNPMIEDFENVSFLIGRSEPAIEIGQ